MRSPVAPSAARYGRRAAAPAIQRAGEAKETRRESCLQPNPKTLPTQAPFRPLNESGYSRDKPASQKARVFTDYLEQAITQSRISSLDPQAGIARLRCTLRIAADGRDWRFASAPAPTRKARFGRFRRSPAVLNGGGKCHT